MANRLGNVTNPKGRGNSGNKTTKETKELVTLFMQDKFEDVQAAWEKLEDVDKVKTYISLVKYVMPTLASVKVEDANGDDILKNFLAKEK